MPKPDEKKIALVMGNAKHLADQLWEQGFWLSLPEVDFYEECYRKVIAMQAHGFVTRKEMERVCHRIAKAVYENAMPIPPKAAKAGKAKP